MSILVIWQFTLCGMFSVLNCLSSILFSCLWIYDMCLTVFQTPVKRILFACLYPLPRLPSTNINKY